MYYFAFVLLALSMLCALAGAAWAVKSLWPRTAPAAGKASRRTSVPGLGFVEKANLCLTGCYIIASAILIYALASYDFSLVYVASYTDRLLPLFYRITAFWAGQAGSMLFWAFSVAICGGLFQLTRSYKSLTPDTRLWYWVFYLGIMSFFGLILVTWNNPFPHEPRRAAGWQRSEPPAPEPRHDLPSSAAVPRLRRIRDPELPRPRSGAEPQAGR